MKKQKKQRSPLLDRLRAAGAGLASTTRGRARVFRDRKKEASRKACRGKYA